MLCWWSQLLIDENTFQVSEYLEYFLSFWTLNFIFHYAAIEVFTNSMPGLTCKMEVTTISAIKDEESKVYKLCVAFSMP